MWVTECKTPETGVTKGRQTKKSDFRDRFVCGPFVSPHSEVLQSVKDEGCRELRNESFFFQALRWSSQALLVTPPVSPLLDPWSVTTGLS